MDSFTKGSVVLVPFPFSDLSQAKMRPAVVLVEAGYGDYVLCQVTSKPYADPGAIKIEESDFREGSLRVVSYARPAKLFTAHGDLFFSCVGKLSKTKSDKIIDAIIQLFTRD